MSDAETVFEELQAGLKELILPFTRDLRRRNRLADFFSRLGRSLKRDDFIQVDEFLRSKLAKEAEEEAGLEGLKSFFERLRVDAAAKVERYRLEFIEDVAERAEEAGLPVKFDFPRFQSLRGIEGEVDFGARRTTINKKRIKSIDPRRIVSELLRLKRDLYDRPLDPRAFLEQLYVVYQSLLQQHVWPEGHAVPAEALYRGYVLSLQAKTFFQDMDKSKFRGYPLARFAVDLWRCFEAGIAESSNGAALRFGSGRGGLWLIDRDGEKRKVAGISFQGGDS